MCLAARSTSHHWRSENRYCCPAARDWRASVWYWPADPVGSYQPPPRSTLSVPLLGPLGLRRSALREALREPIRHPFPGVAGHILYAERTRAFRMAADSSDAVLVNCILVILGEARMLGARRLIAPRIFSFICAARCPLPLRIGRQAPASPLAVTVGILPIDADHRQISAVLEIDSFPFFRRLDVSGSLQEARVTADGHFILVEVK